ncbi:MAG: glycosyltransferase family 2 protein [Syntrophobacteraceae bacterium]
MARTSIIIVSYNSLRETTAPCLESIFAHGPEEDFEVIVVDNNSSDGTVAWLSELMEREPRLKCVFNDRNRGFAGGNNDGIRIASGEYLVLLNSDCLVSGDWIGGLTQPLERDAGIGMTGPVSNSVGNEQKIFTSGATPEEIMNEGLAWTQRSRGESFDTEMLIFFCVALRRDVVEKVGPLDENFGVGFYEDDDYCIRVRQAGYRLVCVEDVFVYHRGGGSFDGAGVATRKLMRENREKLARKHASAHKRPHPRHLHLGVIEGYLDHAGGAELSPDARYRIANRLRVVKSLMPRGWIKRFMFRRLLGKLERRLKEIGFHSV